MDCPACGNAMITLELAEVEIDHCVECRGIWLDAGELELLMDNPEKASDLLKSFQESDSQAEKLRKCPICDKKMAKIVVGSSAPVLLLDKCRRGDGLWFDHGELRDVLQCGQLDPDSRIQTLLADMFGHDRANDSKEANL